MLPDSYNYKANASHRQYIFESIGSKGVIIKAVFYQFMNHENGVNIFNLAFGDLNPSTWEFNDLIISDNKDRDKVLATVAATVLNFTNHFPDCRIYAKGSTPSRTGLYQMQIGANFQEINMHFSLQGENDNHEMEPFRPGVNYHAFLITRR